MKIQHVNAPSRLEFGNKKVENHKNKQDIGWNVLPPNRLGIKTIQDPVLSKIPERIKRNI